MNLYKYLSKISHEKCILCFKNIIILSDKNLKKDLIPIPSLLALSSVHHHLIRIGLRSKADLIIESGEPREVHHFSTLFGYGASAINPYIALETVKKIVTKILILLYLYLII